MGNKILPSCVVPVRPEHIDNKDITIIILAANISYGMRSYGPKSLLNIGEKNTLLEYQINLLKTTFPKSDIILVTGFKSDKIIRHCPPKVRIVENPFFENTNEVEQLRLALNCAITDNVLIIKDSIIMNMETFKDMSKNGSCLIYDSRNKFDKNDIGITIINGHGTIFAYNIPTKWCHIIYLIDKDLKFVKNLCAVKDNAKLYLFEILNILLHKIDKIRAIEPTNMEIAKIDNSRDLEKLRG